MKAIKKIWVVAVALPLLIGQLGCQKFLDRKPLGQAADGDVQQGGVESQVFGLYASLQTWGMTQLPFLTMHAGRADDDVNATPSDGTDQQDIVDHFNYTKDHWALNSLWSDHLNFVTQASGIIHDVDSAYANDPASQINKAEASFLRAYAYFDLVRDYGEVPIIDFKVYTASQANVPKKSVDEVYALIDKDLDFAEQLLPAQWESKYLGRVTKGAAQALHAKAYLYRKNWASALAKTSAVISSNLYSLYPKYGGKDGLFTEVAENSSESVFEIQNYENANGSKVSSNALAQYQGVRGSGEWDLGWGWNLPSESLVSSAYEPGDPRKTATILYAGKPDSVYGATLPAFQPGNSVNNWPYWNKKAYTDPARRASTGDRFGQWLNTMILRYADVLLMDAEAANEIGGAANTTKALADLELVRARARAGAPAGTLPPVTTTDQGEIRTAIKKERRVEFALEFERFYDLVRWTPATDGIDAPTVLGPLGYKTKNRFYPIPQGEVDKSNGVLKQNPEY